VVSLRVRELPPPPKPSDPPLPWVDVEPASESAWRRWLMPRNWSPWGVSLVFHCGLLLVLALWVDAAAVREPVAALILDTSVPEPLESLSGLQGSELLVWQAAPIDHSDPGVEGQVIVPEIRPPVVGAAHSAAEPPHVSGAIPAGRDELLARTSAAIGGGLEGRGARAAMVEQGGGNELSERAVERGLRWLMAHQRDDGSWSFDLKHPGCAGRCRNPGTESSRTAATALVLLPFLGAGHTHVEGEYRDTVRRGLYFLVRQARPTEHGYDLQDGTMYAQALATIALCEAYAMTEDESLKPAAQHAIDFIVYAQDLKGGGWRYTPGDPGDVTVTGWQLMALKSGRMAGFHVPSPTIALVIRFLDSVACDEGAQYGYMLPQAKQTTTAIGLLCRMYTGWSPMTPALRRGVAHLDGWGPSDDDLYYNYYATQVMRHFGASEWEGWNPKMRDYLIKTQATARHESGSWHFPNNHGDKAGRLYNTAMAVMILEVYYRYMPLYGHGTVEKDF